MASPRIVVTSPWKLGLFVFLLVTACGFGLIYAYFELFGGNLDFQSTEALQNFYYVCGGVALLGLLGYLAVVSAAQPADRVAHFGRRRRQLMKKASKVDDPTQIDLEEFQDEPTLAAVLERWRRDRETADLVNEDGELAAAPAAMGLSEEDQLRLEELGERMEQIGEEINSLALSAALHLSRMGDEAAPLMETMDSFQAQAERIPDLAEEMHRVIAGVPADLDQHYPDNQNFGDPESDLAAMESPELSGIEDFAAPQGPSILDAPSAAVPAFTEEAPVAEAPAAMPSEAIPSPEPAAPANAERDELATIHDELFSRTPAAPPAAPVETGQEETVYDLSEFGAEAIAQDEGAAPAAPRVHDLSEFGAVEL